MVKGFSKEPLIQSQERSAPPAQHLERLRRVHVGQRGRVRLDAPKALRMRPDDAAAADVAGQRQQLREEALRKFCQSLRQLAPSKAR